MASVYLTKMLFYPYKRPKNRKFVLEAEKCLLFGPLTLSRCVQNAINLCAIVVVTFHPKVSNRTWG